MISALQYFNAFNSLDFSIVIAAINFEFLIKEKRKQKVEFSVDCIVLGSLNCSVTTRFPSQSHVPCLSHSSCPCCIPDHDHDDSMHAWA